MRKNILFIASIIIGTLLVFSAVQAGYLFDYGELEGHPGAGEANWMAWYRTYADGRPIEILTEDNTNSIDGEDVGYSDIYDIGLEIEPEDQYLEWILQIENFSSIPEAELDEIKMLYGGLGSHSGTLWRGSFLYDNTEPYTDHLIIDKLAEEYPACPIFYEPTESAPSTYGFYSTQPGTYLVYRTQNASGAPNDAGNGRYRYFTTVTTTTGYGTFTDTAPDPKWYIVFQFDPVSKEPIGCHSEPVEPTAAVLTDFTASYDLLSAQVNLFWETASQVDVLGFNVLRKAPGESSPEQINEQMIEVYQPGSMEGGLYSYADTGVEFGQTYTYWIDLIDLGGQTSRYGPVTQVAGFSVFVPILQK